MAASGGLLTVQAQCRIWLNGRRRDGNPVVHQLAGSPLLNQDREVHAQITGAAGGSVARDRWTRHRPVLKRGVRLGPSAGHRGDIDAPRRFHRADEHGQGSFPNRWRTRSRREARQVEPEQRSVSVAYLQRSGGSEIRRRVGRTRVGVGGGRRVRSERGARRQGESGCESGGNNRSVHGISFSGG